MDILERLADLHKQVTTERSHYYVASCARDAIEEISQLRTALKPLLAVSDMALFVEDLTANEIIAIRRAKELVK